MERTATGEFDIRLTPMEASESTVGSMAIAKTFHGGLTGTSTGQMLAVRTGVEDSAGYVAMERVSGTLDGRTGTFALQHSGTMDNGVQTQSVTVVPDSGTGSLTGITGSMTITVAEGKHSYSFRYALPPVKP
ncbi:DUF3224 domain-containing protein [Novosphingobium beihaiensis]|uniref:DUF3224 domain-containing protein n=1 Tax=Novosphingobium beihaiensis TaxID=2930389 RepID=A0ABT0BS26_9SPHN|nr:DUF3224 domain-containing protein [Novosphingobium beihaiensis]MCJ2187454.1 DUF3224 domain-containing protein [Novosphingobium beihaiensis]